jgi:peptidoglycan/LPS O-acetylase OafA/YrhL
MTAPEAPADAPANRPRRRGAVVSLALAALAIGWTALAVLDTATTWRAFAAWRPSEFTVSRYLASELFGLVRRRLPHRMLKYEGHLQGVAILSWTALVVLAVGVVCWVRHRGAKERLPRRALTAALALLLLCLPIAGLSSWISWQCVFVSPKALFEGRVERQAAREGRQPTTDEIVEASEAGARFDQWRRESILHLFQRYRP